jgi:NAD(P)-dependent dehydrogenase (short-subunit alcohol dehydrogenase family)
MTTTLITGAGRGIGLELTRQSLAIGWKVYGSIRHEPDGVAAKILDHPSFHEMRFDVTDATAVRAAAGSLDEPIDILINNAGVIGPDRQSTLDMDFDGLALTLAINTIAPLRVSQAFLPQLLNSQNPRLITISSMMGSMSGSASDRIAYRASKAAVNKIMQGLATDLAGRACVVSMHPGWVQTDMGGSAADITPGASAARILEVVGNLTSGDNGRFLNYDGRQLQW